MAIGLSSRISLFRGLQRLITAPAQPHATEKAVYTVLFFFSSVSDRGQGSVEWMIYIYRLSLVQLGLRLKPCRFVLFLCQRLQLLH